MQSGELYHFLEKFWTFEFSNVASINSILVSALENNDLRLVVNYAEFFGGFIF